MQTRTFCGAHQCCTKLMARQDQNVWARGADLGSKALGYVFAQTGLLFRQDEATVEAQRINGVRIAAGHKQTRMVPRTR